MIAVLGPDEPLTRLLARELATGRDETAACAVYAPSRRGPDLGEAEAIFAELARQGPSRVVVLSSTEVHEPHHHHTGMVEEARLARRPGMNPRARLWLDLEELAERLLSGLPGVTLTVLRPAPVPQPGAPDPWSRLLSSRLAVTLPGCDPSLQLLAPEDLVAAIRAAFKAGETVARGVFQVVPAGVVPLRRALRLAGVRRLPLPRWLQRAGRGPWLDYLRYSWTASGEAASQRLGFVPRRSSAEAAAGLGAGAPAVPEAAAPGRPSAAAPAPAAIHSTAGDFDDWGMDPAYIARYGRTLFRLLHDHYWRIEVRGLENVPRAGRAVLAG
ncbi:MAG TPA: hypothetical protein VMR44_07295, partial [Thermoanaerobaculia bacterium]|nr:hypothetical protein [Thermoanaerobaculia bacterium]